MTETVEARENVASEEVRPSGADPSTPQLGASHPGDPEHAHDRYPFLAHHYDTPEHQFEAGKLGIWIFLVTEVLFFAGLFSAYSIYRSTHEEVFVWAHYYLDTNLGAVNTAVLILSSLSAAWAVRNAQLGQRTLLLANISVTILCALTFMGIKYVEYSHKFHDGLLWGGRPNADGSAPKYRFDPKEPVWELGRFQREHPAAAAAARRLSPAQHGPAASDAAHPGAPREDAAGASAAVASSAGPPVSAERPGAAPSPGVAAASSAVTAPSAVIAPSVGGSAAPTSGEGLAPSLAAANATGQGTAPAVSGASVIATLTSEEALPLIRAGILGDAAVDRAQPSRPKNAHIFFGIYFFMTGLHGLHVLAGIAVWVWLLLRAAAGHFGPSYFGPVDYAALYWHLVDLIWIYLFPLLYLIH